MMALLKEKFAAIDAGFGIDLLRLDAVRVAKRNAMQKWICRAGKHGLVAIRRALVDRLANRFGSDAITVLRPRRQPHPGAG